MDSAQTILLDNTSIAPFEVGARLDALLCYSSLSTDRQQQIADAICADLCAQWLQIEPHRRAELFEARPQYRKRISRASLAKLHHRREQVLVAGQAFLPLVKQAGTGQLPILDGRRRALSIEQIARFVWPPREGGREQQYESRLHDNKKLLRSLRPVAHLAAAYQYFARQLSGSEQAASFDYQDLNFHRKIVAKSNYFADCFHSVPTLANIANRLIRIEWRE